MKRASRIRTLLMTVSVLLLFNGAALASQENGLLYSAFIENNGDDTILWDSPDRELSNPPKIPVGTLSATKVQFSSGKKYKVFQGPGEEYGQAGNGKAVVSTNDWIQVFGEENGWIFILYDISSDRMRTGWITSDALPRKATVAKLAFTPVTAVLDYEANLTDDPLNSQTPIATLAQGTQLIWLAGMGEWAYVESVKYPPMRGFVKIESLNAETVARKGAAQAQGESLTAVYDYAVVDGLRLQQLTSSILLSDGTFLLTGRTNEVGICFLVDQGGNLIQQYRIDTPDSNGGAVVRGAARIGENIIAATYDYETNTSFIAVISSAGKITVTENFPGEIEAVEVLEDGLLVSGSYYNKKVKEVPWAAKVGENGKYEWEFEEKPSQSKAPGVRKHFEFCTEYADEYVLLQHEASEAGNVYSMIRLAKDGSVIFSGSINLPPMKTGCLFTDVMANEDTLVLYGGVCDSNFQYDATVAAINKSAEVLWIKKYTEFVSVGAVGNLRDLYYIPLITRNAPGIKILIVNHSGDTIERFANPFEPLSTNAIVRNIIPDGNDCLWIVGTIENGMRCFISKFVVE